MEHLDFVWIELEFYLELLGISRACDARRSDTRGFSELNSSTLSTLSTLVEVVGLPEWPLFRFKTDPFSWNFFKLAWITDFDGTVSLGKAFRYSSANRESERWKSQYASTNQIRRRIFGSSLEDVVGGSIILRLILLCFIACVDYCWELKNKVRISDKTVT